MLQGGVYIFQLCDWYLAVFTILFIGLSECLVLAWVYGNKSVILAHSFTPDF